MFKKGLIVSSIVLALACLPATSFAANTADSSPQSSPVTMRGDGFFSSDTYLASSVETYTFNYDHSDGSFLRFYLVDKNKKGMGIIVYGPNGSVYFNGHTQASNGYQVYKEGPAGPVGTYVVRVLSDNGGYGYDYSYGVAARAY